MKRHKALEPFSRDHYGGLVVARHLKEKPGPGAIAELMQVWNSEMEDHFWEEELTLGPLAPPGMGERLVREHDAIRALVLAAEAQSLPEKDAVRLGEMIHDHIRWEERELFPVLEQDERIEEIEPAADAMELRRQDSGLYPRRAELVQRRKQSDN